MMTLMTLQQFLGKFTQNKLFLNQILNLYASSTVWRKELLFMMQSKSFSNANKKGIMKFSLLILIFRTQR